MRFVRIFTEERSDAGTKPFKIGCGLGGGDWNVILGLIQKELSDKYTVELWRKEV